MLTNNYKPFIGGVPISIERLSDGLRELGHEVYVFAPEYSKVEEDPWVIRYRIKRKMGKGEFMIPDLLDPVIKRTFQDMNFDIIHVHHPMMVGHTAIYLGKKYHIPVVFTYHTRYEQYLHYIAPLERLQSYGNRAKMLRGIYRSCEKVVEFHNRIYTNHCDLVFAPTPGMKKYLVAHGTKTMVEVMPTGILEDDFTYDNYRVNEICNQYRQKEMYLFCTVSRLEKEKNIGFLLQAMKILKERRGDCFCLLLIGDGSEKATLIKQTIELGLEENVVFTGSIPHEDLRDYYHSCDLFLFASQSETQGIVLLEAMAAGLPIVALDGSGVCDLVNDGITGYRTEKKMEHYMERLEYLLNHKQIRDQMSEKSVEEAYRYLETYQATKAIRCYQSILIQKEVEPVYENKII
jgi:glycosyltransferase involved in cell wall biosynthesis